MPYVEDPAATQQRTPLAEKLAGLFKRIENDGRDLARSAETLADKLGGTIPATEQGGPVPPRPDNIQDAMDLINDKLTYLFADMRSNLERAHRAIGAVGADAPSVVRAKPVEGVSRY